MTHKETNQSTAIAQLTAEDFAFLEHHGISLDEVFDAQGMPPRHYRPLMLDGGYRVAVGVTTCIHGHSMRTRTGGCVQCQPRRLGFQRNYNATSSVYIFYSEGVDLFKVGITGNVDDRLRSMNSHAFVGQRDWVCVMAAELSIAGEVEAHVHRYLREHRVEHTYCHGDEVTDSRELFDCSLSTVLEAFEDAYEKLF